MANKKDNQNEPEYSNWSFFADILIAFVSCCLLVGIGYSLVTGRPPAPLYNAYKRDQALQLEEPLIDNLSRNVAQPPSDFY